MASAQRRGARAAAAAAAPVTAVTQADSPTMIPLGSGLYATVKTWRKTVKIHIRHFVEPVNTKGGRMVPTQKGVTLHMLEFQRLLKACSLLVAEYNKQTNRLVSAMTMPKEARKARVASSCKRRQQQKPPKPEPMLTDSLPPPATDLMAAAAAAAAIDSGLTEEEDPPTLAMLPDFFPRHNHHDEEESNHPTPPATTAAATTAEGAEAAAAPVMQMKLEPPSLDVNMYQ